MNLKKVYFAFFLANILAFPSLGLTWNEALSLAQKNNPQILMAEKQVESAKLSYYRSYSPFLPQLSASASLGQTTSGTLSATSKNSSYGITLSQTFFSGLANYLNSLLAKVNYDYYLASQKKIKSDLLYELRKAFIDLAIAEENISLLKNIVERRKNNASLIELRYENGREDKGALLRTKADLAEAESNLISAQRARSLAKLKLGQLLSTEVEVIENILEPQRITYPNFDSLLVSSPNYIASAKALEKTEINYRKTISEFLPTVSFSASYRKSGTDWPPSTDTNSWSLNFSLPLFPGGSNYLDRLIYKTEYEKALLDFQKAKDDLRYSLNSAYQSFLDALDSLETAKLSFDAASLRAEIARTKYMNGLISYDEWDRIENDYISAQKNLLSRKKVALYAEAAWHNSYGGYVK